ncbi:MAG: hypothetical protein ACK4UJ_06185 [Leptonema sp. (in: bacteria)]
MKKRNLMLFVSLFLIMEPFKGIYSDRISIHYFEKAYSIEKENPKEALKYYKEALKLGLEPDLRKTALWRIYFLLKEEKKYIQAWEILSKLNRKQNIENKFFEDLEYFDKINKDQFLKLFNFLKTDDYANVKKYYEKASPLLKRNILDYYLEQNKDQFISELLLIDSSSDLIESKVFLINYYLENNKYEKAEEILKFISKEQKDSLNDKNKSTILYLMGKIYREREILDSSLYFLYAANYSLSEEEYEKNIALAMFSLYKGGFEEVAYELIDYIYLEPRDLMQKLFIYLVRAEKNPNRENIKELQKILLQIKENNFLKERAEKLVHFYHNHE